MAVNQKYDEYRVNSLPNSGLKAGDRYYLNVGKKQVMYIVSDSLELIRDNSSEFIEKDTMQDMRNLSTREIWALQNNIYKGIKLNGYYSKGDTHAPIDYYASNSVADDDGGAIIKTNNLTLEHSFVGEVDVRYYGVFPSLIGEDASFEMSKVLVYSKLKNLSVYIPKGDQDSKYKILTAVDIYSDIYSDGATILGGGTGSTIFNIKGDVKFKGLKFEMSKTGTSDSAPTAIARLPSGIENISKINIVDCTFKDCRINIRNTTTVPIKNILITGSTFYADFTGLPIFNVQNDVVTLDGVYNVKITQNTIYAKETNRVFKIKASIFEDPNTVSDGIIISNNYVEADGKIDSGDGKISKQVFDLFNGTRTVLVDSNIFKCKNYVIVFEDKSSNNKRAILRSYTLSNNYFENNNQMVHIEGTYGRTDLTLENRDISIIKSIGNVFNSTSPLSPVNYPLEDYQFIDDLTLTGNYYGYPIKSLTGSYIGVNLINCKNVKLLQNTFQNCYPYLLTVATAVSLPYTPKFEVVDISNNTFRFDEMSITSPLFITGQSTLVGDIDILNITHNNFICPTATTTFRAIRLTYLRVKQLSIIGNKTDSTNASQVTRTGTTVTNEISFANTWTTGDNLPLNIPFFSSDYSKPTLSTAFAGDLNTLPVGNYSITLSDGISNAPVSIGSGRGFISFGGSARGGQIIIGTTGIAYRVYNGPSAFGAWQSNVSPNATTSIKGIVNQATASADTASTPSGTYTQAEVTAILTELRDLKSKLRTAGILAT